MTFVFKHPKFYRIPRDKEEARAQLKVPSSKSDQVISETKPTGERERAPGPGLKHQASSAKQQASSESKPEPVQVQEASSAKRQASQPALKGSSFKPEVTSSRIFEPGYKRTSPRFGVQATRINVFLGCFTWKLIWWGEKRILSPNVTFNSSVKKCSLTV